MRRGVCVSDAVELLHALFGDRLGIDQLVACRHAEQRIVLIAAL